MLENLQERKETKGRKSLRSGGTNVKLESPGSRGSQLTITEFYRSAKGQFQKKPEEDLAENMDDSKSDVTSKGKRKASTSSLPKSVRRRLLFG